MKRVYGYKRRDHASGKRYQDGMGAQAKGEVAVIDRETLPGLKEQPVAGTGEEIELKVGAGLKSTEPFLPGPPPAGIPGPLDEDTGERPTGGESDKPQTAQADTVEKEEAVGDLPNHMTGFMATDNVQPSVSTPSADEMNEPE